MTDYDKYAGRSQRQLLATLGVLGRRPLSTAEVARETGLGRDAAWRALCALAVEGWAVQDDQARWVLAGHVVLRLLGRSLAEG